MIRFNLATLMKFWLLTEALPKAGELKGDRE